MPTPSTTNSRYLAPDGFTRRVFNPIVAGLTRMGLSIFGSRMLEVRGRTSGEWRAVPVNPLHLGGRTYLVAPRGHTQWVRNLRAAQEGRLRKGRRVVPFSAVEMVDAEKAPVIRAYLDAWAFEVGQFFDGLDKNASDNEILDVAPGFPVFDITLEHHER